VTLSEDPVPSGDSHSSFIELDITPQAFPFLHLMDLSCSDFGQEIILAHGIILFSMTKPVYGVRYSLPQVLLRIAKNRSASTLKFGFLTPSTAYDRHEPNHFPNEVVDFLPIGTISHRMDSFRTSALHSRVHSAV